MRYVFEGIGPQPPETVILNSDEFTPGQVRDAMNAYQPTHERTMNAVKARVAAVAGEYATTLARQAALDRLTADELAFPFTENLQYDEDRPHDPQRIQSIEEGENHGN